MMFFDSILQLVGRGRRMYFVDQSVATVLLREVDRRLDLLGRVARCFADFRHPGKIEHAVSELVAQRIYAIALGHEHINDHDALRADSLVGRKNLIRAVKQPSDTHGVSHQGSVCP